SHGDLRQTCGLDAVARDQSRDRHAADSNDWSVHLRQVLECVGVSHCDVTTSCLLVVQRRLVLRCFQLCHLSLSYAVLGLSNNWLGLECCTTGQVRGCTESEDATDQSDLRRVLAKRETGLNGLLNYDSLDRHGIPLL